MISTELIAVILSFIATIISVIMTNSKTTYRIEQLEKKVEIHNSVVERVALLEKDNGMQWNQINEMHGDIKDIKEEVLKHADK